MPKLTLKQMDKIRRLNGKLTIENRKKLILGLKKIFAEHGNIGGETDIVNSDNLMVSENSEDLKKVISKTFDTEGDFDNYVKQHRGIEITDMEQQSVINHKKETPTNANKFFIEYNTTDQFGNNVTAIIKKLKEGNLFCWTAFVSTKNATEEVPDNTQETDNKMKTSDTIRIIKSNTFSSDSEGAVILSAFINNLEL